MLLKCSAVFEADYMLLCLLFTDVVAGGGFYSPAFCAVSLIDVEGKVGGAYKQFSETMFPKESS